MIDVDVIEIGTEERVIRPIGPSQSLCRGEFLFGQLPDGGILACNLVKPEDHGFLSSETGEHGVWHDSANGKDGFTCRSYYIFYAFERYCDVKLKIVVAPYPLMRKMMLISQEKGNKKPNDDKVGLDYGIRYEKSGDKNQVWDFHVWTLGEKPLTAEEKRVITRDYIPLPEIAVHSTAEDVKHLMANTKPYNPSWEPASSPTQYIVDFLTGDYEAKPKASKRKTVDAE